MNCLRHDVAWPAALSIMSVFEDCVQEEQHKDALQEIYVRVVAAIEVFEANRPQPEPSDN